MIEALAIGEHRKKRLKTLSKGNFQRVGLAQALLADTRVVIFDEPTHGLDPVWTQKFREIVSSLKRADRAIIIASHNLDELERLADRVAIIDRGRIQRVVTVNGASVTELMAYRVRAVAGGDARSRRTSPVPRSARTAMWTFRRSTCRRSTPASPPRSATAR